jgi:hypothetical protein
VDVIWRVTNPQRALDRLVQANRILLAKETPAKREEESRASDKSARKPQKKPGS